MLSQKLSKTPIGMRFLKMLQCFNTLLKQNQNSSEPKRSLNELIKDNPILLLSLILAKGATVTVYDTEGNILGQKNNVKLSLVADDFTLEMTKVGYLGKAECTFNETGISVPIKLQAGLYKVPLSESLTLSVAKLYFGE